MRKSIYHLQEKVWAYRSKYSPILRRFSIIITTMTTAIYHNARFEYRLLPWVVVLTNISIPIKMLIILTNNLNYVILGYTILLFCNSVVDYYAFIHYFNSGNLVNNRWSCLPSKLLMLFRECVLMRENLTGIVKNYFCSSLFVDVLFNYLYRVNCLITWRYKERIKQYYDSVLTRMIIIWFIFIRTPCLESRWLDVLWLFNDSQYYNENEQTNLQVFKPFSSNIRPVYEKPFKFQSMWWIIND